MMKVIVIALFCIAAFAANQDKGKEEKGESNRLLEDKNEVVVAKNEECLLEAGKDEDQRESCLRNALGKYDASSLPVSEQKETEMIKKFALNHIVRCQRADEDTADCILKAAEETTGTLRDIAELSASLLKMKARMEEVEEEFEAEVLKAKAEYEETHICEDIEGKKICKLNLEGKKQLDEDLVEVKKEAVEYYKITAEEADERFTLDYDEEIIIDAEEVKQYEAYQKKIEEEIAAYEEERAKITTCDENKQNCVYNAEGIKQFQEAAEKEVIEATAAFALDEKDAEKQVAKLNFEDYFEVTENGIKYFEAAKLLFKDYDEKLMKDFQIEIASNIAAENKSNDMLGAVDGIKDGIKVTDIQ